MKKIQYYKVGEKAEITHVISKNDISKFIDLTGDDNKLHYDSDFAAKTNYLEPVAHGMLSASFISTIIGTKLPGDGALWTSQSLQFLLPVRVGDKIKIIAEVKEINIKNNSLKLSTNIYNQNKNKVISGEAEVKIIAFKEKKKVENKISKNNKVALIIGGSGGIGSEVCKSLSNEGYQIAIHYCNNIIKAKEIREIIKQNNKKSFLFQADILIKDDIIEMIDHITKRMGKIDIIVNCATVKVPNVNFENIEWSQMESHFNINVKSNFMISQEIVKHFKKNKAGKIVFLTSQITENVPPADWMPYVVGKYSLNGFAKSLAIELAKFNINVNMVSPGLTETNLISNMPEKYKLIMAAKTPLKRLASPKDIADVISFLVSEKSNYMTGETIRVNGGQIML